MKITCFRCGYEFERDTSALCLNCGFHSGAIKDWQYESPFGYQITIFRDWIFRIDENPLSQFTSLEVVVAELYNPAEQGTAPPAVGVAVETQSKNELEEYLQETYTGLKAEEGILVLKELGQSWANIGTVKALQSECEIEFKHTWEPIHMRDLIVSKDRLVYRIWSRCDVAEKEKTLPLLDRVLSTFHFIQKS